MRTVAYPEGVDCFESPVLSYKYAVVTVIGSTDDVRKVLKAVGHGNAHDDFFSSEKYENAEAVTFKRKLKWPVIYLPKVPRSSEEIGTLAHEAVHAIHDIYEQRHALEEEFGKEIYCHLVGSLVEDILRWSRTLKKKSNADK